MKFEVDLNKIPVDELEHILEMKKKGVYNIVDDYKKIDKREDLINRLQTTDKTIILSNRKETRKHRHPIDWKKIVDNARKILRHSDQEYAISRLYRDASGTSKTGENIRKFSDLLNKNSRGIRKRIVGKRVLYSSRATSKALKPKSDKRTPHRGRFICSRANVLMKNDITMSRSQALTRACSEWDNKGYKNNIEKVFPEFSNITQEYNVILKGILRNVINNNGKVEFRDITYSLDITDTNQWYNLVAEIMEKSQLVSNYFNVDNKFKHKREGNQDAIVYN